MKPSKGYNPKTLPATCHPLFSTLPVPHLLFPSKIPPQSTADTPGGSVHGAASFIRVFSWLSMYLCAPSIIFILVLHTGHNDACLHYAQPDSISAMQC